ETCWKHGSAVSRRARTSALPERSPTAQPAKTPVASRASSASCASSSQPQTASGTGRLSTAGIWVAGVFTAGAYGRDGPLLIGETPKRLHAKARDGRGDTRRHEDRGGENP